MIAGWLRRFRHVRFLRRAGARTVAHSGGDLLGHLRAVSDLLRSWGARPALCDAALFHSVYGTEFLDARLADPAHRAAVRSRIGAEAERIAWLWHAIRRTSLVEAVRSLDEADANAVLELLDGSTVFVTRGEILDLVDLWVADAVEQLPRRGPKALERQRGWLDPMLPLALPAGAQRARALLETGGGGR